MGWHMKLVICVQLAYLSVCLTREMSVVREWTSLDLQLTPGDGQESRRSIWASEDESWVMYKDRVFVTLFEQPYTLAYFDLRDNSTTPLLLPYPSYENQMKIRYVTKVRVDRCDRLWVLCLSTEMDDLTKHNIIVIDLKTDSILKNITFPDLTYSHLMTVDDSDCDNEYVYIFDYGGVWTYSWAEDDSWRHNVSGYITSMIVAPNSIVYYNILFEPAVYYMSTTHLRDKSNKTIDVFGLGRSRKLNVSLYSSALDAKSDVLYYFNNNINTIIHAVPCWTSERCSSNCQDVRIDPIYYIIYLRYITVDENGYLWTVIKIWDGGKIKFRLSSVAVKSTCIEPNDNDTTNTSTDEELNPIDDEVLFIIDDEVLINE